MTREQLLQLKNAEVPLMERVDLADVKVDPSMPIVQRAEEYLRQIKNPYAFKCGEIAVNVCFSSNGKTIQDALVFYLLAAKNSA